MACKQTEGNVGRAPKPLIILVTSEELFKTKEVQSYLEKGHDVSLVDIQADIILGPNVWQSDIELVKYLPLAVRAARDKKYGGKGVTHEVEDTLEKPEGGGEGGGVAEGAVGDGVGGGGEIEGGDSGA